MDDKKSNSTTAKFLLFFKLTIMQYVCYFFYMHNIFSFDVDGMKCLLGALEAFCQCNGLTVNMDKSTMVVVQTIQSHRYPMLICKGKHVQFIEF